MSPRDRSKSNWSKNESWFYPRPGRLLASPEFLDGWGKVRPKFRFCFFVCIISRNCLLEHIENCSAMNYRHSIVPRSTAISFFALVSPLTYAVYSWSVHCKFVWCRNNYGFFNYLHFWDTLHELTYRVSSQAIFLKMKSRKVFRI